MTLSTSVQENKRKTARIGFGYLLISVFCAVFGAVYERFSHEVYSYYMLYAFLFPLILGAVVFLSFALFGKRMPGMAARWFYHAGVATWTVGSFMEGVLEIYGTTNRLVLGYWIVGAVFVGIGVSSYFLAGSKKKV